MTNIEIRRRILEMLYDCFKEHPYNRVSAKEFKELLGIAPKELHFNIIYLEEKGYVELQKPLEGSLFVGARITPKGVDLVEDEYQMSVFLPEQPAESPIPIKAVEALGRLIDEVSKSTEYGSESREIMAEEIKEIKLELGRTDPSYSSVKNFVDRLKERNSEIYQKLIVIIKEPAVAKILSNAAKKELGI